MTKQKLFPIKNIITNLKHWFHYEGSPETYNIFSFDIKEQLRCIYCKTKLKETTYNIEIHEDYFNHAQHRFCPKCLIDFVYDFGFSFGVGVWYTVTDSKKEQEIKDAEQQTKEAGGS